MQKMVTYGSIIPILWTLMWLSTATAYAGAPFGIDAAGTEMSPLVILGVGVMCAALLANEVSGLKVISGRWYRFASLCAWLAGLAGVLALLLAYSPGNYFIVTLVLMGACGGLCAGVLRCRQGSPAAWYYAAAWASLFLVASTFALRTFEVSPANNFTTHGPALGSLAAIILLVLGLVRTLNARKGMNSKMQREAVTELQQKVDTHTEQMSLKTLEVDEATRQALRLRAYAKISAMDADELRRAAVKNRKELQELDKQNKFITTVHSSITDGFAILDNDIRFVEVNKRLTDLLGVEVDQLIGNTFMDYVRAGDLLHITGFETLLLEDLRDSVNVSFVVPGSKENLDLTLRVRATAFLDGNDEPVGYLVISHDDREMQSLLQEQSRQLADLATARDEIKRLNTRLTDNVLKRYLPPELVEDILRGEFEFVAEPKKFLVTVLFSDICEFTKLGEVLDVDDYANQLNEYLTVMNEIIFDNHGMVDKFIGDAIMVLFGAPKEMDPLTQSRHAVACARAMQDGIKTLNKKWVSQGLPEFSIRVGMHQGEAIVGNFGSKRRSDYTCIGSVVNLASRIEGVCEPGAILLSEAVGRLLEEKLEMAGTFELRGVAGRQPLYRLVSQDKID